MPSNVFLEAVLFDTTYPIILFSIPSTPFRSARLPTYGRQRPNLEYWMRSISHRQRISASRVVGATGKRNDCEEMPTR